MFEGAEVKLSSNESRESVLEEKALAEMSFLSISSKYQLAWAPFQSSSSVKELEEMKSINLDGKGLAQPLSKNASSSSTKEVQVRTVAYLEELSENIEHLLPKFKDLLNNLAKQTGVRVECANVKPSKRSWEKACFDYNKNFSKLVDIGRGAAIAENVQVLVLAVHWIIKNCEVIRLKNRFGDARKQLVSKGGYRDVLINIKLGNYIFEIQVHLTSLYVLREETSRVLEVARTAYECAVFKLSLLDKDLPIDQLLSRVRELEEENSSLKASSVLDSSDIIRSLKTEVEKLETEVADLRLKVSSTPRQQARLEAKSDQSSLSAGVKRILNEGTKLGLGVLQPTPSNIDFEEFVEYAKKNLTKPECQYGLAWCLTNGRGLIKREHEAVYMFRLASEQCYAPAQCSLGSCYQTGTGVVKNDLEAVRLFRLACDQNYAPAMCSLGACYQYGTGVIRNEQEAIRLYLQSAEQNYAPAQCSLGVCFHTGMGVNKSEQEAMKLYKMSADQNFANALYNLGVYYQNGVAVAKNEQEAVRLYHLAADQGFAHAQYALGVCYQNGTGCEKNEQQAVRYYQLAAELNNALALHALGLCLRAGVGVERNDMEGARLIRLARRLQAP